MTLAILTLFTALAISAVATFYSIIGLIAIFSAAVIPIAVMGVVLELGKLITASWLYHYWRRVPKLLKTYLISVRSSIDVHYINGHLWFYLKRISNKQQSLVISHWR